MEGDWSFFDWWGEYQRNPSIMGNPVALKFSKPIRMLDFFTQDFSRDAYLLNSFFVWHYDWNLYYRISFGY